MAGNPTAMAAAAEGPNWASVGGEFDTSSVESFVDSDIDDFDDISVEEPLEEVYDDPSASRPTSPEAVLPSNTPRDQDDLSVDSVLDSPLLSTITNPTESASSAAEKDIPPGKSIAHHYITSGDVVYCSFDLETGGEYCGIVQISAELFSPNPADALGLDFISNPDTFNSYVQPPEGALWNDDACRNSHNLTSNSECIKSAPRFDVVWGQFCSWISRHVGPSKTCIFVAYNGATCDLRWLWRHLQAPRTTLSMPDCMRFFLDPLHVIQNYKSCPLNPTKSKLESLELGVVWKYIKKANLNGAHDSLVDAKAQTDIVTHKSFVKFIDKKQSIRLIEDIFSKTERARMAKRLEPTRSSLQDSFCDD